VGMVEEGRRFLLVTKLQKSIWRQESRGERRVKKGQIVQPIGELAHFVALFCNQRLAPNNTSRALEKIFVTL